MDLIEKIEVKSVEYEISDAQARNDINNLQAAVEKNKTNIATTWSTAIDKISASENSSPTAVVNFVNGLKINGALISYNKSTNTITFS